MSARVYLGVGPAAVRNALAEGRLPGPRTAYAVTDELRAVLDGAEEEDLEYAALLAAADDSWDHRTDLDPPRRMVLAVDVASVEPHADGGAAVTLSQDVPWKRVVALHVDTDDLAVDPTTQHDPPELAWYAASEIAHLLG